MRFISYTRVSTQDQAQDGWGLAAQDTKIGQWAAFTDNEIVSVKVEAASGKSLVGRPEFADAMRMLRNKQADGIVVTKLDRLARSVRDFADILADFQANGWSLQILDLGVDLGTPSGRMIANILAAVAEFEREVISLRTREGLAEAKRQGKVLGRPRKVS